MFNLFKPQKPFEPLDYELRKYFENNLLWLMQEFPEPAIENRKVLVPVSSDFPIQWNGAHDNAVEVLSIVGHNMQINPAEVKIEFFDNGMKEIDMGGSVIFTEVDQDSMEAAGLYHHKKEDGKHIISLDEALLNRPDALIATIAHELAHVKLLGENKLEVNDEMLTDLATAFFGLGVFNANTAFQFYNHPDRWGVSASGYLQVDEWAYALALFSFIRSEDNPDWGQYLNRTLKADFNKCLQYMKDNTEDIFKFEDNETV